MLTRDGLKTLQGSRNVVHVSKETNFLPCALVMWVVAYGFRLFWFPLQTTPPKRRASHFEVWSNLVDCSRESLTEEGIPVDFLRINGFRSSKLSITIGVFAAGNPGLRPKMVQMVYTNKDNASDSDLDSGLWLRAPGNSLPPPPPRTPARCLRKSVDPTPGREPRTKGRVPKRGEQCPLVSWVATFVRNSENLPSTKKEPARGLLEENCFQSPTCEGYEL